MIAYCNMHTNTKTWMCAPSVKLHGTRKGCQNEGTKTRGGPIKVIWYFPIAPRVHRLLQLQVSQVVVGMAKSVRKIQ
jgi:hypothetical protein